MGETNKLDFDKAARILGPEDEETLAAIDRGIAAAEEGRVVPLEDVRRRIQSWLTRSSSPKTQEPI